LSQTPRNLVGDSGFQGDFCLSVCQPVCLAVNQGALDDDPDTDYTLTPATPADVEGRNQLDAEEQRGKEDRGICPTRKVR